MAPWPREGVAICAAPGDQTQLAATTDHRHGAAYAWTDSRSGEMNIYAVRLDAAGEVSPGWVVNGTPICTATGAQQTPTILTDGQWGFWVAWLDDRESMRAVYIQRLTPEGQVWPGWPVNGRRVCANRKQDSYSAFADHLGGLLLGWTSSESNGIWLGFQHLGADGAPIWNWSECGREILLARGGHECVSWSSEFYGFAPGWPDGVVAVSRLQHTCVFGCHDCHDLDLFYAELNGAHASAGWLYSSSWWISNLQAEGNGSHALRVFDKGTLVRLGGIYNPSWTVSLPTYASRMIPDGRSGFHVVNSWPSYSFIWRLDNDGVWNSAWGGFAGRPIAAPPAVIDWHAELAPDALGGAFIVWRDGRMLQSTGFPEWRATWIREDGERGPGWREDGDGFGYSGVTIEPGPLVGNRRDAVIASWRDRRNGEWDLFAYRLTTLPPATAGGLPSLAPLSMHERDRGEKLELLGARPHPAGPDLRVEFTLSRAGDAALRVIDVAGRIVGGRRLAGLAAGRHAVALGDAGRLAPGLYFVELAAEGEKRVRRVVVQR
ncbi:MAG: hypothetical protein ABIS67_10795 [Candidatus Eisenbacteria bacterium]